MFDATLNEHHSRLDRLQLAALCGLMLVGAAFVYSATMASEAAAAAPWYIQGWFKQMVWYGLGLGCATGACLIDYRILARWSFVLYWATIVLLILVLIPGIGSMRFNARRWFDLHVFQLQPSEFAKLAFILAQASFLSRPVEEVRVPVIFWKALGLILLPFVLIFKEPDLGSALVLLPTGLVMLYVAGTPWLYLRRLITAVGIVAALLLVNVLFSPPGWWQIKLENYQRQRLLVYFGADFAAPNASVDERARARKIQAEKSYQVRQALISVGSGGLTGKGWRKGNQTALGFLPPGAAHNDFIFSVIAEEKGFVGSLTVLTLYGVVLFTGLRIAGQARDRLGKLAAVGVVTLLFSHIFINIGMNIRIVPVTGIPLPLLSYGGSSVLGSLIAIGILQNVHIHRRTY
ncbi:MAG TPA: FtsW/RodA/SpoVE family cell cycle protein [Candidatus Binatia bacterium]|jgi:rod shape determining protein RodA|nr:FtsW/RodA/SpoVE family cell cycle protein [Candidatus Binatia bacterium]